VVPISYETSLFVRGDIVGLFTASSILYNKRYLFGRQADTQKYDLPPLLKLMLQCSVSNLEHSSYLIYTQPIAKSISLDPRAQKMTLRG